MDVAALAACLQRLPLHELLEVGADECEPWCPGDVAALGASVALAASTGEAAVQPARLRLGGPAAGELHAHDASTDRDGSPAGAACFSPGSIAGGPGHAAAMVSSQRAGAGMQLPRTPDSLHPVALPPATTALASPQRVLRQQPARPEAPLATSALQAGPPASAGQLPGADSELDALLATLMAPESAPGASSATAALRPAPVRLPSNKPQVGCTPSL